MRLSYHGSNHYNSVVNPKEPLPLGDGSDKKVSLRDLRLQQDGKHPITQLDGKKLFPMSPELSRGLGRQQQYSSLRRLRVNGADFEQAWKKIEKDGGPIKKSKYKNVLKIIIEGIMEKAKSAIKDHELQNPESLKKAFDELKTDEWQNKILSDLCSKFEIMTMKDYQEYYYQHIDPVISSTLENSSI